MAKPLQAAGDTRNLKPGSGSKRPHGRIFAAMSASTEKPTTCRFNWVWTLLSSNSYAKLSRLSIARVIHHTLLRPPMLQHCLRRFRARKSSWIGGGMEKSALHLPRLNEGPFCACDAISISPQPVVPVAVSPSSEKQPPRWLVHMRSNMTTFYTFARSVDALCKLRRVCHWSYYSDTHQTHKMPDYPHGAG